MRVQHPWSLTALQKAGMGRNAVRHAEQTLTAPAGSPFDGEQKFTVMAVTDSSVDGHALHRAELAAEPPADLATGDASRVAREEMASGHYPRMRRHWAELGAWRPEAATWMDDSFERGLAALLEGLVRLRSDRS